MKPATSDSSRCLQQGLLGANALNQYRQYEDKPLIQGHYNTLLLWYIDETKLQTVHYSMLVVLLTVWISACVHLSHNSATEIVFTTRAGKTALINIQ